MATVKLELDLPRPTIRKAVVVSKRCGVYARPYLQSWAEILLCREIAKLEKEFSILTRQES